MQRVVARLAVGLAALIAFAAFAGQASAVGSPDLVISQVYGGGGNSGATLKNDYVELYNRSASDVSVTGWSVQYASSGGSTWQRTSLAGTIPAGGRYLVQEAAGAGGTIDLTPDATGTIPMSGTAGKVVLMSTSTAIASGTVCPTGAVDIVGYGSATTCSETAPTVNLSNTTAALRKGNFAQDTDNNSADFTIGAPAPKGVTSGGGGGDSGTPLKIDQIQGAAQVSPVTGTLVSTTGIVTAVDGSGFYMQDPQPDADAATSEGIYVFGSTAVAVGDAVSVTGKVSEFTPGGATSGNLPSTELSGSLFVTVSSHSNPLPAPTVAHPPTDVIENDSSGNVTTSNTFDPAGDGLDYWESLEGMRVQVNAPQAVGPQNSFGELPVVGGDFGAGLRTPRGGLLLTATDGNPERIVLDDQIVPTPPGVNVGDTFDGPAVGVLSYNFGNFMLEITQPLTRVDGGLQREVTAAAGPRELSVATFNVENLDVGDGNAKFDGLADRIVHNLRSPKIVALEEVQDNSGPTDDGVVESNVTLDTLVAAIVAAGGPSYSYTYIAPVNDQDGGEPGGNIRIAFLYDPAAGVSLPAGAVKGGSTDANAVVTDASGAPHLALDPGRIDPNEPNGAWASSRKPLAGEFLFRGETVVVIGNHFNSKGGDNPLMGRFQPPVQSSTVQRHKQAAIVHDFVGQILAADPEAKIVVLGDLNDFQFSDTVHILEGGDAPTLFDMIDTLPANEQYSYEFEGNAQVLDHILVSKGILDGSRTFDVVHINAEFSDQLSDHDPSVLTIGVDDAPTVTAGGPYAANEGSPVTLTATGSDANGDSLTYAWDFNGDGVTDATGASVSFTPADGPADVPVTVTAFDGAKSASDTATVHVANVAPTATFVAPASVTVLQSFTLALTGATDASAADVAAGLQYRFDCGSGYGAWSSSSTATCPTTDTGPLVVRGAVRDKDGGVTEYTASVDVTITPDDLCAIVSGWAKNAGQANSLCVKLRNGQIEAFGHEVDAQTGKAFTAEQAALLKRLAARL